MQMTELTRAETLEARLDHAADVYERERQRIFSRDWILVGHESEVADAGSSTCSSSATPARAAARRARPRSPCASG